MNFSLDKLVFKGYIDLVIKTTDGKYHVIDWKTCSWGWDREKKNSKLITYQLTLYKKFFCQKHNIDPSLVETHFALLKRTAKRIMLKCLELHLAQKRPRMQRIYCTRLCSTLIEKCILRIGCLVRDVISISRLLVHNGE